MPHHPWVICPVRPTRTPAPGRAASAALAQHVARADHVQVVHAVVGQDADAKGSAWFPYTSPALFSMTIGFASIWLFSILDRSAQAQKERADFEAQEVRSETGLGASGASGH